MRNSNEGNKSRSGQTNRGSRSSQKGKKGGQRGGSNKGTEQEIMPDDFQTEENMEDTSTLS